MSDKQEIKKGSVGISNISHDLLSSLVYEKDKFTQDKPFSSIVEAFRFAFALGYSKNEKSQKSGKKEGIAPRQFVVDEYLHLIKDEVLEKNTSLGNLISEYAEGGCNLIEKHLSSGKTISQLL